MSLQTMEARAEVREVEHAWSAHQANCPACAAAARSRKAACCGQGAEIRAGLQEARSALKESVKLDHMPIPGQETLF